MNKVFGNLLIAGIIIMSSCVQSEVDQKKQELQQYKKEQFALTQKIRKLEMEIAALDPEFARATRQATLVTTIPVEKGKFEHYLEVTGSVESRKNVTINAETAGRVLDRHISEGDVVQKGQLLISLDDKILRSNIREVETQLELAKTLYEKRAKLWERNIGSEVQYLEAKNNVEALESRLAALNSQLTHANIRAPFAGSVDEIFIKVGEVAQPGLPLLRLVSNEDMYIKADFSEAYIGRFKKGSPVEISLPSQDTTLLSRVTSIGNVIDLNNRTFFVEVDLPRVNFIAKPNQIAVVKIKDFEVDNAVIVPTNLIQMDNSGDYVYVVEKSDSIMVAKKAPVKRGATYQGKTMVSEGLSGNEILINQGFRQVAEGHTIKEVEPTI